MILLSRYSTHHNLATSSDGLILNIDGGYSVLHAWPNLGDPSLEDLYANLKNYPQEKPHPLVERALAFAAIDRRARKEGRYLLNAAVLPPSHKLINVLSPSFLADVASAQSLLLKIKIGQFPAAEVASLQKIERDLAHTPYKLRLDANLRFSKADFHAFLMQLSDAILNRIDFIEDPFSTSTPDDWAEIQDNMEIRIAYDFAPKIFREAAAVWIIKPTRQDVDALCIEAAQKMKRVVMTSSLDHPLGLAIARSETARAYAQHPLLIDACGLNAFDGEIVPGRGYGFDEYFKKLSWAKLK